MSSPEDERKLALFLFVFFCLLNAYFFQGGNWNQNGRFDTTRAIVEKGTIEIGDYQNTRDISIFHGKVYLNKPLGISLLATPVYFSLYHAESQFRLDPNHPLLQTANAHVLAFFTSGLPAAFLVVLLFFYIKNEGLSLRDSAVLASSFGLGSLVFPYSGAMMSHNAVACFLFAAWYLISRSPNGKQLLAAGVLAGYAVFCDYFAFPVALLFFVYLAWRLQAPHALIFLIGPIFIGIFAFLLQYHYFGGLFTTAYAYQNKGFSDPNLLFGMFEFPYPQRIYWLTVHPFRGLFFCCPMFLLALLSPFARKGLRKPEPLLCFVIFLYFLIATAAFNGWHGGTSFGPRYLIPGLPFLYTLTAYSFPRFRAEGYLLIAVSAVLMLIVSAVSLTIPLQLPGTFNPLAFLISYFIRGEVSISNMGIYEIRPAVSRYDFWESYNLGEVIGCRGPASLIPLILLAVVFYLIVRRFIRTREAESGSRRLS